MSGQEKEETIVSFDALDAEDGGDTPDDEQKLKAVLTFLKDKLEGDDYAKVLEGLGVKDEMTNAELYAAIKELVEGKGKGDDDDDDDEEEKDAGDFKDFMKKCMEGGKDLKECREEYKEKYPDPEKEPKEEEISEVEELAKTMLEAKKAGEKEDPKDKVIKDLEKRLKILEDKDLNAGASAKVDALIQDKHVAPVQKEGILKLAARLDDEGKNELFDFFEKTQKFSAHQDAGLLESGKPGLTGGVVLTPERKAELIQLHGLDGLIEEKANLDTLPWRKRDN